MFKNLKNNYNNSNSNNNNNNKNRDIKEKDSINKNNQLETNQDDLIAHKLAHALVIDDTEQFIKIYDKIPLDTSKSRIDYIKDKAREFELDLKALSIDDLKIYCKKLNCDYMNKNDHNVIIEDAAKSSNSYNDQLIQDSILNDINKIKELNIKMSNNNNTNKNIEGNITLNQTYFDQDSNKNDNSILLTNPQLYKKVFNDKEMNNESTFNLPQLTSTNPNSLLSRGAFATNHRYQTQKDNIRTKSQNTNGCDEAHPVNIDDEDSIDEEEIDEDDDYGDNFLNGNSSNSSSSLVLSKQSESTTNQSEPIVIDLFDDMGKKKFENTLKKEEDEDKNLKEIMSNLNDINFSNGNSENKYELDENFINSLKDECKYGSINNNNNNKNSRIIEGYQRYKENFKNMKKDFSKNDEDDELDDDELDEEIINKNNNSKNSNEDPSDFLLNTVINKLNSKQKLKATATTMQFNNYDFSSSNTSTSTTATSTNVDDVIKSNLLTTSTITSNQVSSSVGMTTSSQKDSSSSSSSSSSTSSNYKLANLNRHNLIETNIDSHGSSLTNSSKQDDEEEYAESDDEHNELKETVGELSNIHVNEAKLNKNSTMSTFKPTNKYNITNINNSVSTGTNKPSTVGGVYHPKYQNCSYDPDCVVEKTVRDLTPTESLNILSQYNNTKTATSFAAPLTTNKRANKRNKQKNLTNSESSQDNTVYSKHYVPDENLLLDFINSTSTSNKSVKNQPNNNVIVTNNKKQNIPSSTTISSTTSKQTSKQNSLNKDKKLNSDEKSVTNKVESEKNELSVVIKKSPEPTITHKPPPLPQKQENIVNNNINNNINNLIIIEDDDFDLMKKNEENEFVTVKGRKNKSNKNKSNNIETHQSKVTTTTNSNVSKKNNSSTKSTSNSNNNNNKPKSLPIVKSLPTMTVSSSITANTQYSNVVTKSIPTVSNNISLKEEQLNENKSSVFNQVKAEIENNEDNLVIKSLPSKSEPVEQNINIDIFPPLTTSSTNKEDNYQAISNQEEKVKEEETTSQNENNNYYNKTTNSDNHSIDNNNSNSINNTDSKNNNKNNNNNNNKNNKLTSQFQSVIFLDEINQTQPKENKLTGIKFGFIDSSSGDEANENEIELETETNKNIQQYNNDIESSASNQNYQLTFMTTSSISDVNTNQNEAPLLSSASSKTTNSNKKSSIRYNNKSSSSTNTSALLTNSNQHRQIMGDDTSSNSSSSSDQQNNTRRLNKKYTRKRVSNRHKQPTQQLENEKIADHTTEVVESNSINANQEFIIDSNNDNNINNANNVTQNQDVNNQNAQYQHIYIQQPQMFHPQPYLVPGPIPPPPPQPQPINHQSYYYYSHPNHPYLNPHAYYPPPNTYAHAPQPTPYGIPLQNILYQQQTPHQMAYPPPPTFYQPQQQPYYHMQADQNIHVTTTATNPTDNYNIEQTMQNESLTLTSPDNSKQSSVASVTSEETNNNQNNQNQQSSSNNNTENEATSQKTNQSQSSTPTPTPEQINTQSIQPPQMVTVPIMTTPHQQLVLNGHHQYAIPHHPYFAASRGPYPTYAPYHHPHNMVPSMQIHPQDLNLSTTVTSSNMIPPLPLLAATTPAQIQPVHTSYIPTQQIIPINNATLQLSPPPAQNGPQNGDTNNYRNNNNKYSNNNRYNKNQKRGGGYQQYRNNYNHYNNQQQQQQNNNNENSNQTYNNNYHQYQSPNDLQLSLQVSANQTQNQTSSNN